MKKALIWCVVTILLISGVACKKTTNGFDGSKELKISIFEAGGYEYISNAAHKIEINGVKKEEKNSEAPRHLNGSINGRIYNANYQNSTIGYQLCSTTDNYRETNKDWYMEICINKDTQNVDFYYLSLHNDSNLGKDIGRDNCFSLAQQYLSKYVNDSLEYSLIFEERYDSICCYQFVFAKIVKGVRLSKARIGINFAGEVTLHDFTELGCVLEEELPSQENIKKIEAALDSKMLAIYQEKYNYKYEVVDTVFLRLADGTYAMEYYIDVELTSKSSGDVGPNERIRLIALLEDVE